MKKRTPRKQPAKRVRVVTKVTTDTITVSPVTEKQRERLTAETRKRIYELRRDGEPLFRIGQAYNLTAEEVGLVLAEPIQ